jgi:hypothetical protein
MAFRDILVTPFSELLDAPKGLSNHKGGPIWPEWEQQVQARHCRDRRPVDRRPDQPRDDAKIPVVTEPLAWCGPLTMHFGHQIADFSTRIPVYRKLDRDLRYCFSVHPRTGVSDINTAPEFFLDLLRWFDVSPSRVRIINRPILAQELICVPQQEQLPQVPPSQPYLDLLDEHFRERRIKRPRKDVFYISRAGMPVHFAGEGYIEYVLGRNGVRVVRPECLSLHEQLRIYAAAKTLLFSEGSAMHGMQLLGRNIGQVHVLNRRAGSDLARQLLQPRCAGVHYHDVGTLVHGINLAGEPALGTGISILDKAAFFTAAASAGIALRDWSNDLFRRFAEMDVEAWYRREAASPRAEVPGSLSQIKGQFADLGLASR